MKLTVHLPTRKIVDASISRVQAEDRTGAFGIRPGHEPFMTALSMGVMHYALPDGEEKWLAVDEGFLLTDGKTVEVYTHDAYLAETPEEIHRILEAEFGKRREAERERRTMIMKMQLAAFKMLFGYER
jgi:F-type H+-transporting ATPase subunit epsilon